MVYEGQPPVDLDEETQRHWRNSPVTVHAGTLSAVRERIPMFERRRFVLAESSGESFSENKRLDTIVRRPFGEDRAFIPVGTVSRDYTLVSHHDVVDVAAKALDNAGVEREAVKAELAITEYGERMALSLYLPESHSFDPGDGHPMALRLECINSVDGSTRFRAFVGWFRLVCSNGLVIGVTRCDVRRRHVGDIRLGDIASVLQAGLHEAEVEKKNLAKWRGTRMPSNRLEPWVDDVLRREWGFRAAARAYHIARTGQDAEVVGDYRTTKPTTIEMRGTRFVPGAPGSCDNLFDLSQVLAWLARDRGDVQEQMEWREQIPLLMRRLATAGRSPRRVPAA
jgi:hypothetical protein